jgi:hypothetical protein
MGIAVQRTVTTAYDADDDVTGVTDDRGIDVPIDGCAANEASVGANE